MLARVGSPRAAMISFSAATATALASSGTFAPSSRRRMTSAPFLAGWQDTEAHVAHATLLVTTIEPVGEVAHIPPHECPLFFSRHLCRLLRQPQGQTAKCLLVGCPDWRGVGAREAQEAVIATELAMRRRNSRIFRGRTEGSQLDSITRAILMDIPSAWRPNSSRSMG